MNDNTQIALTEINEENAATIFKGEGLDPFFQHIKDSVNEVPDLTTKKGRDRVASLAAQVSRSKTAVEKHGRDNLRRVKELPKRLEAELREFVNKCDELRDEVRKPLTEWEAEQERLAQEKAAQEAAAALALLVENDHEIGLLMNRELDRELAAKAEEAKRLQAEIEDKAEQERQERETRIAVESAEKAKREAEEKAARDLAESQRRELEAKLEAERAAKAQKDAEEATRRAVELAEQQKAEAVEREKQQKLAAEAQQKAAVERAEAAERKRQQDEIDAAAAEQARRDADKNHRKKINGEVLQDLIALGMCDELAKEVIKAIVTGGVRNTQIKY